MNPLEVASISRFPWVRRDGLGRVNRGVSSSLQQGVKGALPNLWQHSRKSAKEKGGGGGGGGGGGDGCDGGSGGDDGGGGGGDGGERKGRERVKRSKGRKMTARLSNGSIYLPGVGRCWGVVDTYIGGV